MNPMPFARLAGLGCALLVLSACEASMEDVVAEHRAPVEAVFAQITAVETSARSTAPITEDRIDTGGATIVLDRDTSNALFIHADDLAAPTHANSDRTGATRASRVEGCGEALRGEFPGIPRGARLFLEVCRRAEYLFVLRTRTDEPARLLDAETFSPGRYDGDVLLFRLADGALLGGFAVSAESSDEVMVRTDGSGVAVDAIERLNSDMNSEVFNDIDAKLREHVPGVLP